MSNNGDCLISRRKRYSGRKRKVEMNDENQVIVPLPNPAEIIVSATATAIVPIENSFNNGTCHLESKRSVVLQVRKREREREREGECSFVLFSVDNNTCILST